MQANKLPYTDGNINSDIVIIGEAPGVSEEQHPRKLPFVGRAGVLLDKLLTTGGISRQRCYLTNVFKERPYRNDIKPWLNLEKKDVVQTQKYCDAREVLINELKNSPAKIIIPVGSVPFYTLSNLREITKRRGSILQTHPDFGSRTMMPTLHPASALRQYIWQYFIAHDLVRARQWTHAQLELPQRVLQLRPTFYQMINYLESANECSAIGFDIEVIDESLSCFAIAKSPTDCMCFPLFYGGKDYVTHQQEVEILRTLARLLENPDVVKVGQNIIFDCSFMFLVYGLITKNIHDTMVMAGVLHPEFPKGLDFLTSFYTLEPYYKDEGKKWMKNALATIGGVDNFFRYNAKDAAVTLEIYHVLYNELIKYGNFSTYENQLRLIEPLIYTGSRGIQVDCKGIDNAKTDAWKAINESQAKLNELTAQELNVSSSKQIQDYFYNQRGCKPITKYNKSTGKTAPTADEKALKKLASKGFKEANLILNIRHSRKMVSTYYEMEFDADGRMRCAYNPVGTKFGRISSSKTIFGLGGNMQNLPHSLLDFLYADKGCLGFKIDLSQAENRVVAWLANDQKMIHAFLTGQDVHRLTAGLIFNKRPEDISTEPGSCALGGGRWSERDWGKRSNHSLNYGIGPRQFATYYEIPESESKFLIDRYFQVYTSIVDWQRSIVEQLQTNRTLTNLLGRRMKFLDRWDTELFKQGYCFIPQSTVADKLNRDGICELYYNSAFEEVDLLMTVHDSVIFQLPLDIGFTRMGEILLGLKTSLESPLSTKGREFVLPMDMSWGFNFGKHQEQTETKSAKIPTTADELGKLIESNLNNLN